MAAGRGEAEYLDDLRAAGWNPVMHTVMVQDSMMEDSAYLPATKETAKQWKNFYKLPSDVLYDPDYTWVDRSLIDRWSQVRPGMFTGANQFPYYFYIHTANMRVLDVGGGFGEGSNYKPWVNQEIGLLDFCAEQDGIR